MWSAKHVPNVHSFGIVEETIGQAGKADARERKRSATEKLLESFHDGDRVRLRLAVLDDPNQAADELHKSLLEHGPGWWGVRRSNLSILAPKGGLGESVAFALRYKLVCWGAMSVAGSRGSPSTKAST